MPTIEEQTLSEEEFDLWYSPSRALQTLAPALSRTHAIRAIGVALRDALLPTAARSVIARRHTAEDRFSRLQLPIQTWAEYQPGTEHSFWSTAQIDTVMRFSRNGDIELACHGVRFQPEAIGLILQNAGTEPRAPNTPPAPTAERPQRRVQPPYRAQQKSPPDKPKKVTKDELRQWFPEYERNSQDFRFDAVNEAAAAHFDPRRVTRQPLRDVIGEFERTRNRGKPIAS